MAPQHNLPRAAESGGGTNFLGAFVGAAGPLGWGELPGTTPCVTHSSLLMMTHAQASSAPLQQVRSANFRIGAQQPVPTPPYPGPVIHTHLFQEPHSHLHVHYEENFPQSTLWSLMGPGRRPLEHASYCLLPMIVNLKPPGEVRRPCAFTLTDETGCGEIMVAQKF